MKIESISDYNYSIYISSLYIDKTFYEEDIGEFIKLLLLFLKKIYNIKLNGFYNVSVYINKRIGIYIKIEKQNKYDIYMEEIDLKIIVYKDSKVYYKTIGIDNINKYKNNIIKYQDNYFIIDINNIELSDKEIMKLVEFGIFVFKE